jgi:hypothetical protein
MTLEEMFRPHFSPKPEVMQKTIDGLNQEVKRLSREVEEQAVLNGKGSEREARLLAENAALKTALDHQTNYQRELRADRDRLDWLDKTGCWLTITGQKNFVSGSARAVIDAAMGEGK